MSDYIKREDAIKIINSGISVDTDADKRYVNGLFRAIRPADVAPVRHGRWIYDCCDIVCSECGTAYSDEVCYMMRDDVSYHEPRYCLWCGARMDGEDNETD